MFGKMWEQQHEFVRVYRASFGIKILEKFYSNSINKLKKDLMKLPNRLSILGILGFTLTLSLLQSSPSFAALSGFVTPAKVALTVTSIGLLDGSSNTVSLSATSTD